MAPFNDTKHRAGDLKGAKSTAVDAEPSVVAFAPDITRGWLGGLNYVRNLLGALADNPSAAVRPILVTGGSASEQLAAQIPERQLLRTRLVDRRGPMMPARAVVRRLFDRDPLLERRLLARGATVLSHSPHVWRSDRLAMLGWIPDFQHRRLPDLFSERERRARDAQFARIAAASTLLILSSESARDDLAAFLPAAAAKTRVLRFVTAGERADAVEIERAAGRYGIAGRYLFVPNQFWAHKNHRVVIEALGVLKARGVEASVVATGEQSDYRSPGHFDDLIGRVHSLGIQTRFRTLGTVPYGDVMALMGGASAVINPSLCEGWSTSVEEAKSLGKQVILSDIDVHREQDPPGAIFFDPSDAEALAAAIEQVLDAPDLARAQAQERAAALDHAKRRRAFAEAYGRIVAEARALVDRPA